MESNSQTPTTTKSKITPFFVLKLFSLSNHNISFDFARGLRHKSSLCFLLEPSLSASQFLSFFSTFSFQSNATLAQSSATCPKIVHSTNCKKSSPEIHETRPNFTTFPAHCAVIPAKNQVMFLKTARFKMADTQKTKKMGDFQVRKVGHLLIYKQF